MTLIGFAVIDTIVNLVLAFVVLMFMILIHELGHYTAGKIFKFKINEFSIGMGPKLFSKTKKNGEVVSLRLLPLGGFCAFEAEDEEGTNPHSFNQQKPWKRLIVLFAGAFFNFVSAILIAVVVFSCFGDVAPSVKRVYEYSPQVNQTMLLADDAIYQVNGKELYLASDFSSHIAGNETVDLLVKRDGNLILLEGIKTGKFTLTYVDNLTFGFEDETNDYVLKKNDQIYLINGTSIEGEGFLADFLSQFDDNGILNITVISQQAETAGQEFVFKLTKNSFAKHIQTSESSYEGLGISINYVQRHFTFGEALARTFPYCVEVSGVILRTLGQLFTGKLGLDSVGGPISTIAMTSQVVASGFGNVLSLIVMISVNLAIFNLLPVPALDGCRMIFVIIEWIRGKPGNRKLEAYINGIGLILLFAFVIIIDLLKL